MGHLTGRFVFSDGDQYPFWWIIIPVVGVIALACLVTLLRYRRRKLRRTLAGYRNNALRRDIEAMGPPRHRPLALNRRWYTTGPNVSAGHSRWRSVGLGAGLNSRDEGLNELGEAPPAYTARQKQAPGVQEIELLHVGSSQADVTLPPATATTAVPPGPCNPPAYSETQEENDGSLSRVTSAPHDGPERPPPAVLSSR